jgi:hypothetical protein
LWYSIILRGIKKFNNKEIDMKSRLGIILAMLMALIALTFSACAPTDSTLGDGVIDPVEAAFIQVAVGASMSALPETIKPSFTVTKALIEARDTSLIEIVEVKFIDILLAAEIAKLDLDPLTAQSCNDLLVLIKARLKQQFTDVGISEDSRLVMVWQVVDIVHNTAQARLAMVAQ